MRLINGTTLQLEEFFEPEIPRYAILSHTWEKEEVTFKEFTATKHRRKKEAWRYKNGAQKILRLCKEALAYGLQYAWVDTCCIDKCSSSELTEAINSMFRWYQSCVYCYVYLSDFDSKSGDLSTNFTNSRWFTRGWTLQEMIAPPVVRFYDCNWQYYGSINEYRVHSDVRLVELISSKTGVPKGILIKRYSLDIVPVAQKMSWAAHRQTTRQEDLAYCLMGLFNIHLPLIYGEGISAFIRLQEEIIRERNDLTIFAWEAATDTHYRGILATSPREFQNASNIVRLHSRTNRAPEFAMTNKGLKIELDQGGADELLLPLDCCTCKGEVFTMDRSQAKSTLAISLRMGDGGIYMRDRLSELEEVPNDNYKAYDQIYIFKNVTLRAYRPSIEEIVDSYGVEGSAGTMM